MANEHAVRRDVGALALMFTGLGSIIGCSVFWGLRLRSWPGPATTLDHGRRILICASTYAELGAMFPESGGAVRYGHYSHGSLVGFIAGWSAWIAIVSVIPVEAEASAVHEFLAFRLGAGAVRARGERAGGVDRAWP